MLLVSNPLTAAGILDYHKAEWSASSLSYFSEGRKVEGQFHGVLAAELGLTGSITDEQFERLANGQHPLTGKQLIFHRTGKAVEDGREIPHRAGWDLTFSASKSVSLTALVGGDERVRHAHRLAVNETASFLERNVQAKMGGNRIPLQTGKWIAIQFEHDTSRPVNGYPSPDLHTHLILFNLTGTGQDGQAHAIESKELFNLQATATAIYRNRLHAELRKLGYRVEQGEYHEPQIQGYSPEYLAAESQRSQQIKDEMERLGLKGRLAASIVAKATREDKLDIHPDELRLLHQEHGVPFGNQAQKVVEASMEVNTQILPEGPSAKRAVDWAIRRLSERHSVIERNGHKHHGGIVQNTLEYAQGHVALDAVEREIEWRKMLTEEDVAKGYAEPELVRVSHYRPNAPGERYATRKMLAMEREVLGLVMAGQGRWNPIADTMTKDEFRQMFYQQLNDNQKHLIWDAMHSRDQIFGVQGVAGARKTSSLTLFAQISQDHGYRVQGLTPTGGAAEELRKRGVEAETLAAHNRRRKFKDEAGLIQSRKDKLPTMYLLDESSLADTKAVHRFLTRLKPTDRAMLIGDVKQHDAIEAGRIFAQLQHAGMLTLRLDRITRQERNQDLLRCVIDTFNNRIPSALERLESMGVMVEQKHRGKRFDQMAEKFTERPNHTLIVAFDNESRQEINEAVRAELRRRGIISGNDFATKTLVNRQELYEEDTMLASKYRLGDRVRFGKGSIALRIKAHEYMTVIGIDTQANTIMLRDRGGKVVTLDPEEKNLELSVFRPEDRHIAVGDRLQFTAQWKVKGVTNRSIGTVEHLDARGNVKLRLEPLHPGENGRLLKFNLSEFAHLDHAYAMTSFSAQSKTYPVVLGHIDTGDSRARQLTNKKSWYVMLSRASDEFVLYTDNKAKLGWAVNHLELKPTALSMEQVQAYRPTPGMAVA